MFFVNKLLFVFIIVSTLVPANANAGCGELKVSYICDVDHTDAEIILLPSEEMKKFVQQNITHTWWHYFNDSDFPRKVPPEGSSKYEEKDFILTIHDLNVSESGMYTMGCSLNGTTFRSGDVEVHIPAYKVCFTTITEQKTIITTPSSETTSFSLGSSVTARPATVLLSGTVIVVIAVCSVIIVVVIAGTILLVLRKRAALKAGTSHLQGSEGGLAVNFQEENEQSDIYNEIDIDNSRRDKCGFNSSNLTLLTLQNSPALPKRPINAKRIIKDIESEYDIIMDGTNNAKDKKTVQVLSVESRNATDDDGYATIRQEEKSLKNGKNCEVLNNNNIPEYAQVLKRAEYAQVHKRKVSDDTTEQSDNSQDNKAYSNDYKVVFPDVDYNNIVKSLGNNVKSDDMTTLDEPVKYCNIGSKRRSQARASRKSLQYALLDLTDCDANLDELNCGPYDLPSVVNLVTCQYASIDFDKKAFVAPIRKAPSSWYKRKQNQKKKL